MLVPAEEEDHLVRRAPRRYTRFGQAESFGGGERMDRIEQHRGSEQDDAYERLARKALAGYGLADARLTRRGTSTRSTFEVSAGGPARHYALRICPTDTETTQLEREILWLTALCRDTQLIVPEPILSSDGRLVRKVSIAGVHGVRPCVLLRWVDGESLDEELDPDHLRGVGRMLAVLHTHAEAFRWPEEITPPRRNATLMSEILDERLLRTQYSDAELEGFREAVGRVAETMAALRDGPNVAGVIHGDPRRSNLRFAGHETRAFGFDACRWGYYAYDLAVVQGWIERREAAEGLATALHEGYRSLRHLSNEVERSVPLFAALRSIDRIQSILARPDRGEPSAGELHRAYESVRRVVEENR